MELQELKRIIPYQWKIQSTGKDWKDNEKSTQKGTCVAYIDARDCMDLLDNVCGPENRQTRFKQVKNTMFCEVGILCGSEWVRKSDAGTEAPKEGGADAQFKGEASDSFKRACVQRGIGRFLYDFDIMRISQTDYNNNKYKLTEFINGTKLDIGKPKATKETIDKWFTAAKAKGTTQAQFLTTVIDKLTVDEESINYILTLYQGN